ncbi:MAG: matrixin family metalloprotease [Deltaproteobacteria bacterium]|nr:matrixin family metalloprotease [Deltaproteobacteria bacterium]
MARQKAPAGSRMTVPPRSRSLLGSILALAGATSSANAQDYVCTAVPNSNPPLTQVWINRCIPYAVSSRGTLFASDERRQLIAQSFRRWSELPCTDLSFVDVGLVDAADGFDPASPNTQRNVIASLEEASDLASFPDPRLLAVTLTRYSLATGEIVDADILFNASRFAFDDLTDVGACAALDERPYDLRNTLVHEIGHFIGFDHVDVADATMFGSAQPCEVTKRDLAKLDRDGVCDVYPAGLPATACSAPAEGYDVNEGLNPIPFRDQCDRILNGEPGGCSCRTGAEAVSSASFVALLFVVVFARRFSGR